jgi:hypothetical protein
MKNWKQITLNQLFQPWKYCWKHNSYKGPFAGSCHGCLTEKIEKKQKIVFKNPTPRKCKGHKKPFIVEDSKCSRCGGQAI